MLSQPQCRKCGSSRTRVVGQSAMPPGVLVNCGACGYSSLVTDDGVPVADVETCRVERLVKTIAADRQMPCELQAVTRTPAGCHVTACVRQREIVRFDVKAGSFAAMRADIERALQLT
jgi:hypothetical protein